MSLDTKIISVRHTLQLEYWNQFNEILKGSRKKELKELKIKIVSDLRKYYSFDFIWKVLNKHHSAILYIFKQDSENFNKADLEYIKQMNTWFSNKNK